MRWTTLTLCGAHRRRELLNSLREPPELTAHRAFGSAIAAHVGTRVASFSGLAFLEPPVSARLPALRGGVAGAGLPSSGIYEEVKTRA